MRVEKKGTIIGFGLLLVVLMTGCPPGTENILKDVFQPPTLAVRSVTIQEFTPAGVTLLLDVDITNPNPVGASVAKVDYNFELSGRPLVQGAIDSGVELKPSSTTNVQVPVPLSYNDIIAVFTASMGQDSLPYAISGNVFVKTPLGNLPIPYRHEDELSMP